MKLPKYVVQKIVHVNIKLIKHFFEYLREKRQDTEWYIAKFGIRIYLPSNIADSCKDCANFLY